MSDGPSGLEPRFSDDRQWYWNGTAWIPAAQAPVPAAAPWQAPAPGYSGAAAGAAAMVMPQKPSHTGRNVAIGCGGLIALFIIIAIAATAANLGSTSTKSSSAAALTSPSATATQSLAATPSPKVTPSPKASPTPPAKKVLLDKSGSGISKTAIFTTPSEWEIDYTFDCTNFGFQGNFQIYVYDGSSALVDVPANQLGMKGSDTIFEHNLSGPYYLEMNSECKWHVVVKA